MLSIARGGVSSKKDMVKEPLSVAEQGSLKAVPLQEWAIRFLVTMPLFNGSSIAHDDGQPIAYVDCKTSGGRLIISGNPL